ncbi:Crp/Fnr family transcriptional regulator [Listeria swaminathanii]|uniref:Crp/Fnr family transcriptional regulator n=1 Tax=Listeria swaminathanii TaxID=2713501 RepID=A0A7X1A1S9_9LIST|nr:Crp/Fnr family transcriptional regulator [Listeria swaminathanii]MBC2330441.1 Crp/Fnr family transcriptional regulator [Listeria swaminathanii]MCD2247763.1 Crp/Fnr family transcriptional regulator [Listeria marthii]UHP13194.1 Crp/Fnr family transcriptional regulator [Listeria marthii]
MKYIEYHDYIKRDAIIYAYLLDNFSYVCKQIKAWESVTIDRDHVLLVKNGTLIEESDGKKKGIVRCFFQKNLVFPTRNPMVLKALETSEVCLISAEGVFGKLEEDQILSNFFLQIAEKNEQDLKRQALLGIENSKNKVVSTLNFLLENNLANTTLPVFPEWLQINILAKLANCSISTISSTVNELHNDGKLDIKSSPWKLKGREMRLEYFEREVQKVAD